MMRRTAVTVALVGLVVLGAAAISSPAIAATCDPATDVQFNGHCYYLDGSGGACDAGYALASQSVLTSIAAEFAGKTYKHQVSDNCCIYNSDPVENWGMTNHCNQPGQFNSGEPSLGGADCTDATNLDAGQLTLCGSLFTVGAPTAPAPALSPLPLAGLVVLLGGVGIWLTRKRTRITP